MRMTVDVKVSRHFSRDDKYYDSYLSAVTVSRFRNRCDIDLGSFKLAKRHVGVHCGEEDAKEIAFSDTCILGFYIICKLMR